MERNTATMIDKLNIGDRFYKCKDRNKNVFTKVEIETSQTAFQTYKHGALKDGEKFPVHMKADTAVIFLRHKTEA